MYFKTPLELGIVLDHKNLSQTNALSQAEETTQLPIYKVEDHIKGRLDIKLLGKKVPVKHQGIKIHLEGYINIPSMRVKHCFADREILLEDQGILDKDKTLAFSFEDFPRMVESYKGFYGQVKYIVKAVVYRSILHVYDIIEEKEIIIHLNYLPQAIPRIYRLIITCGGEPRLEYHQNKHDYLLTDCVVGKVIVEPNQAKLISLSFSFIRKEVSLLIPKLNMLQAHEEVLDVVDLSSELGKMDNEEGGMIPFRLFLSKYNIQPTSRHQTLTALFSVSYVFKIRFQDESRKTWVKEVKVGIWRGL